MADKVLNLMVIDEDQLYAEKLVGLLTPYYDEVNLGFWDEKVELIKALRNTWDVLVFSRAYDMTMTDVVGLIQEHKANLPIIQLLPAGENALSTDLGLPQTLDGDMVKALSIGQDAMIVLAIGLLASYSRSLRYNERLNRILKETEQRANILISNSKSAVAYIDEGVHIFANEPYLELFGYDSMSDIIGVPVVDLIAGSDNVKAFKQFLRKFDKGDRSQVEFDFESRRTDGDTFQSSLQLASATFEGSPVVQMIIQRNDVGNAELAKQLANAARQDPLTGLNNRTGFMEAFHRLHEEALAGKIRAWLLYVRINNIGKISSSAGILGVDTVVKYVANVLGEVFTAGSVSRFGDAAFMILLSDVKVEQALALAKEAHARVQRALIEAGARTITTSIAVSIVPIDSHAPAPEIVLERALDTLAAIDHEQLNDPDQAVHLFDISAHASDDDDALAEYISSALTQDRFVLKYQPIYDVQTDNSDLFEVYMTLPLADGGELTFEQLVAGAKKHNLLDKIDRWQLIHASKALATTRHQHPNARILLALSAASLADSQLPVMVTKLTKAIGGDVPPICLQFYEQDLIDYLALAKRQFMALEGVHCPAGIVGFGMTVKSEDVLSNVHAKMARLSRSYTKDLSRESHLDAVKSLITKAREYHCDILMPDIEDAQTMSMAWSVGARYLQGAYLQMPAEAMVYAPSAEGE